MRTVKIFGERNTGTNALTRIIQQNSSSACLPATHSEVDPDDYRRFCEIEWVDAASREAWIDRVFEQGEPTAAWKHCATSFASAGPFDDSLVLFTVRHPASWIVALFDRPYHQLTLPSDTIAEFAKTPWRTVTRERLGGTSLQPLELYEAKLASYRTLAAKLIDRGIPHRFVGLEDLVLRQEEVFRAIACELDTPVDEFQPLSRSAKQADRTLEDYQAYYGSEAWRGRLAGIESEIDAAIDWEKWAAFGYLPLAHAFASADQ